MKPSLQLKLSQHLTLTPQLQQSIRLLQLSTLELHQEVERFLQENPLLEKAETEDEAPAGAPAYTRTDAFDAAAADQGMPAAPDFAKDEAASGVAEAYPAAEFSGSDGWGSSGASSNRNGFDDDEPYSPQASAVATLRDHLISQPTATRWPSPMKTSRNCRSAIGRSSRF